MSIQSETGRKDYSSSDHAPKGQRVAGAEIYDMTGARDRQTSVAADWVNKRALQSGEPVDNTNVVPEVVMEMARKNKK